MTQDFKNHKFLRLSGIYNSNDLLELRKQNIRNWGLDFRPKSFNFLQGHIFQIIMKDHYLSQDIYFLKFENEIPELVNKLLFDLCNNSDFSKQELMSNVFLEFTDQKTVEFYQQFNWPYFIHFYEGIDLGAFQNKGLQGVVLSFTYLEQLQLQGKFHNFIKDTLPQFENLYLGLEVDWNSNLFPSLFDFLNFNFLSLDLNHHIEQAYRQINLKKINQNLGYFLGLESVLVS